MKLDFFRESGRLGGRKRAKNLTPKKRSEIAARAADARWKTRRKTLPLMPSVRLDVPCLVDPVYLEEVLVNGSLHDWGFIYEEIADRPFGKTASALESVLSATRYYGVTPLWKGLLSSVRGSVSHEKEK
ncbi:MAG TPA: hypothetical protein DF383_08290 [Deltaproteobacteria bacterium]|nr:hypothetical protein [Deltaproteobacteria bacterium]